MNESTFVYFETLYSIYDVRESTNGPYIQGYRNALKNKINNEASVESLNILAYSYKLRVTTLLAYELFSFVFCFSLVGFQ